MTVSWVAVVVAKVEVALTVNPEAVVKVKLVEVPTAEVPEPNRMSLAVKAGAPVPPLATGRMPFTWEARATGEM